MELPTLNYRSNARVAAIESARKSITESLGVRIDDFISYHNCASEECDINCCSADVVTASILRQLENEDLWPTHRLEHFPLATTLRKMDKLSFKWPSKLKLCKADMGCGRYPKTERDLTGMFQREADIVRHNLPRLCLKCLLDDTSDGKVIYTEGECKTHPPASI